MAREHEDIAAQVVAAARALLDRPGSSDGHAPARATATRLRRHMVVEERVLFGLPVALSGAHAEPHLTRDHVLIDSLLELIDGAPATPSLHTFSALRRLHHVLEHHDERESAGLCVAVDSAMSLSAAESLALELADAWADPAAFEPRAARGATGTHDPATLRAYASPGPYAEALWRTFAEGAPLVLPLPPPAGSVSHRATEAALASLHGLLTLEDELDRLGALDVALRIDRLRARESRG